MATHVARPAFQNGGATPMGAPDRVEACLTPDTEYNKSRERRCCMSYLLPTDILKEITSMRRYARSLTRDEHAADDVVQDALLKALEKRHMFRPDGSRRGWLLAIVHNIFVSTRRRENAQIRRDMRFANLLTDRLEPNQEHAVCLAQVAGAFAGLPEQHRAILHLIAIEEQSYQQAALILDIPIGTVMSRLSRARAALRRLQSDGLTLNEADSTAPKDKGTAGRNRLKVVGGNDDD